MGESQRLNLSNKFLICHGYQGICDLKSGVQLESHLCCERVESITGVFFKNSIALSLR